MKKILLIAIVFCCGLAYGQTNLSPGDIAIIGVNCDTPDEFSFVTLVDLEMGTEIIFTDNGVFGGILGSNEGTTTYIAPSAITAGTVINYNAGSLSSDFSTASLGLSGSGDQVIAYQNSSNPTFLFAVQLNSSEFQVAITYDSNQSELPPGLTVGTTAVAVGAGSGAEDEVDNATYNESILGGTKAVLLAAIANPSNWTTSNSLIDPLADGPFTITASSDPSLSTSGSLSEFETISGTSSSSQSFTIEGNNLTADATVTAVSGFEVSSDDTNFSSSVNFSQSGGDLSGEPVTVYTRVASTATSGTISGSIVVSSTGAPDVSVSISAFVASSTATGLPYNNSLQSEPTDWYKYSFSGADLWSYSSSGYFEGNAFNASAAGDDWLISPKFDGAGASNLHFSFEVKRRFEDAGNANPLTVFYSTDYSGIGSPQSGQWTEVTSSVIFGDYGASSDPFTFSGFVDLSNVSSAVYIAFVYKSSGSTGGSTAQIRVKDFSIGEYTEWNGSAWSNNAPAATSLAGIAGTYNTSSGNITALDLAITSGTLTISDGGLVQVESVLVNNAAISVSSAGSLMLKGEVAEASTGTFTINKNTTHSTTDGKYSIIGSPVTSGMTSSLGGIVYKYDETIAYGTDGSTRFTEVTTAESMAAGDAYFSANTGAISFTGTPNAGTITQTLVYDETTDGSATNAGFNLVSNPYTAAIDVDALVAGNSDISASVYLWQDESSNTTAGSNDDYVVYNSTTNLSTRTTSGGKDFDGFVRSTQGFFVKATAAASLNFTASMMSTGNNDDAGFYRKANENENFLRLSLNHKESYSDIIVLLRDNAALGFDRLYDAHKIGGSNMSFYSFIDNAKFAIQGLPQLSSEVTVDLGFDVEEAGTYTMNFEEGMFDGRVVYLLDTELNKRINLSEAKSYTFESAKVASSDRFQLVLSSAAILSIDDITASSLNVFTSTSVLNVQTLEAYDNVNIKVLSLNGAVALEARNVDLSTKAWSIPFNKNGLFIIAIETKDGLLVKKFLN